MSRYRATCCATKSDPLQLMVSEAGRDYRLDWRLGLGSGAGASFELVLEAMRRQSATDNEAGLAAVGRLRAAW